MSNILERLKDIVGAEHVVEKPQFSSSTIGFRTSGQDVSPDYLVRPNTSDQVQAVVKLANETGTPLIPVSSRAPHTKGGTRPDVPGTVILDLSRMNKILRVNAYHRLVLVEPGVTWEELSQELAKHGLRITPPLLPREGKSVIATLLDREPLLTPKYQWNMNEPLRSMEIIFGTGDRIYSGMGGHRGDTDEAWENGTIPVTNAGPHQFDFMKMVTATQGTFGVVTWASIKVELATQEEKPLFVSGKSVDELSDFLYSVLKFRFGDEVCLFNNRALETILVADPSDLPSLHDKVSQWTAFVQVKWGGLRPKEKVASQEQDIRDIAQENGLVPTYSIAGLPAAEVTKRILAPGKTDPWESKISGFAKTIFFLSTLDKVSQQLRKAAEVMENQGYALSDCPIYIQPLHQGTAVHCQIVLPIKETDLDSPKLKGLYDSLSRELAQAGAFYSRPYGVWSEIAFGGNTQHTIMTRKMKEIFDPRNIMNPGKLCF